MTRTNRSFSIQTSDSPEPKISVQINETPGVIAENLSLATWGSSYILANQLHRWRAHVHVATSGIPHDHIPVLELGAGTSLVGISAAAIWQRDVVVTDLPSIVPGLAQNISANQDLLDAAGVKVSCAALDWSSPMTLTIHNGGDTITTAKATDRPSTKARIILAADTVYAEDHPSLLISTIQTWLAPGPEARVMLCYVLRHSYIDIIRALWETFEQAGLECVEEGKQEAEPDVWDDVAPFEWCVWRWKP